MLCLDGGERKGMNLYYLFNYLQFVADEMKFVFCIVHCDVPSRVFFPHLSHSLMIDKVLIYEMVITRYTSPTKFG